jgi:CubicO group peptidase (beta-lactamase class C family)
LSAMILYEKGILDIDGEIELFLPVYKKKPNAKKTIRQLLTHTGGLPAWYPTYLVPEKERTEFISDLNAVYREPLYSCLGYIILGTIIEKVTGMSLGSYFAENIARKLGLHILGFGPVRNKSTVAATEFRNEHEQKMASRYGDASHVGWRRYLIKGEVHDGNAYYSYGGVAGNAGLFSNLSDLVRLIRAYLSAELLSPNNLSMMIKEDVGSTQRRNLGWRLDPFPGLLSPDSFGHTGFTGTMLTVDPRTNLIIILLTNAVHPKVKLGLMDPIRHTVVQMISNIMNLATRH